MFPLFSAKLPEKQRKTERREKRGRREEEERKKGRRREEEGKKKRGRKEEKERKLKGFHPKVQGLDCMDSFGYFKDLVGLNMEYVLPIFLR